MDDLSLARGQMAFSLGFHIIFACISMVMPFYMALAYRKYLKGKNPVDLALTRAWSKGAAVLFATGAVSGTALSFQLGLLWPGFMKHAGPIIGMPFSLEGAAFFLEAIFLGLFLYGWKLLPPRLHLLMGVMVGVCGFSSGVLVVAANGWMNAPTGFTWTGTEAVDIDPWKAFFNVAWPLQSLHMQIAAFQATGFGSAGIHAFSILRGKNREFHSHALKVILPLTMVASLLQPLAGDLSAKAIAQRQPEKLAAMEAHFQTEKSASLVIGGIVDEEQRRIDYALKIPGGLSFLAYGDFDAEVRGVDSFPPGDRPPVAIPHYAFQTMVGLGGLMSLVALFWVFARWRRPEWLEHRRFLSVLVLCTPFGILALEAGWTVTEVGRQPWVIYHVLKTADAVTPVPGLGVTFAVLAALYLCLGTLSFGLLGRLIRGEMMRPHDIPPDGRSPAGGSSQGSTARTASKESA